MPAATEFVLYRVWGEAGLLLYVGVSKNFGARWKQHANMQPWWSEMRQLTADEWFSSRADAEAAERAAIGAEQPKYNKRQDTETPASMPLGCICAYTHG